MIEGKVCLVTGSSGFIGKRLTKKLTNMGCPVREMDKDRGFDIADRDCLAEVMYGVDYVFHMAVLPYNACTVYPRGCIDTNLTGTLNVIEAAIGARIEKLVYSSASAVYGNIDTVAAVDESHPCNPDSLYGASKLMGEIMVRNAGLPYIILRYMNVYGPGQVNGLVPTVLKCMVEGAQPTISGDGLQAFDFVHVDDVVRANILAAERSVADETFNIGGENAVTVRQVVDSILRRAGSTLTPVFKEGNPARRVGSSAKAARLLGYNPHTSFSKGIKEIVDEHISKNEHTDH